MKSILAALAVMVALSALALAHEQKFMGTVDSIQGEHLQITTTQGKSVMIMLDQKSKIVQGKTAKKPADIKAGMRVVVTTIDGKDRDGKMMLVAKQIVLGTGAPSDKK